MGHGLCERQVFAGVGAIKSGAANSAGFAERGFQSRAVCCPINPPRQARNDQKPSLY
jgi:hypothetical protein